MFGFSIVARLPLAMLGIGLVVHVQRLTGSFAAAGLTTGAYAVSEAIGGPLLGRLADHGRQTPVLLASSSVAAVLLGTIAVMPATTPLPLLLALAAGIGLATPPVGACLRGQLPTLMRNRDQLQALYALETSLTELTWVCGPPLILFAGALWSTGGALALAGLVLVAATVGFATQPASRAWRPESAIGQRRGGALRSPAMRTLTIVLFCFGVLLGADEVAVTASVKALEGTTTAAAPLLALWGTGSFAGGLILTRFSGGARTASGIVLCLAALTVGHLALIPAGGSVLALAGVLLIAGGAIAPTEAIVYGMVDSAAPKGTVTEAFAWLATAMAVGSALGAAAGGGLTDQVGPVGAFLLAGAAGALAALTASARARTLPRLRQSPATEAPRTSAPISTCTAPLTEGAVGR